MGVANVTLEEGYLEEDVAPITVKKTKDWCRVLPKEEIKALEGGSSVRSHTVTMERSEVDSGYATTDNEKHIQEQLNQDKSYLSSESTGNQSNDIRRREPLMDGPYPGVVGSLKDA